MLHDRGGEFLNTKLLNFLNVMGIRTKAPSAFSPFANGIVERHNGVLKATMSKLNADYKDIRDDQIRLTMILDHATFAKIP